MFFNKNIKKILFLMFVFVFFIPTTQATPSIIKSGEKECVFNYGVGIPCGNKITMCVYTFNSKLLYSLEQEAILFFVDGVIPTISAPTMASARYGTLFLDVIIDPSYTAEKLSQILEGKCPTNLFICESENDKHGAYHDTGIVGLIDNTLMMEINYPIEYGTGMSTYKIESADTCQTVDLDKDKTVGESIDKVFPCDYVDNKLQELRNLYCHSSEDGCDVNTLNDYNKIKQDLSSRCNQVLKHQNYVNDCVKSCLNVKKEISKIEGIVNNGSLCGFSEKLILWIANIVKWVKYIVPVIVIVLGILDFIKAIANGKEDEMKKAQGHFIKRLIAAALIFIAPFIIEFILNKMGFDANGCGIIDL